MARVDDYMQALALGRDALRESNPDLLARFSGAEIRRGEEGKTMLSLGFLNDEITLSWPDLNSFSKKSGGEPPLQQQILLLHYLKGAWASSGAPVTGEWIAFQEVPDGRFYLDAFHRRAKHPLVQTFGNKPERLVEIAAAAFGAVSLDRGDFSVMVQAFPLVPIALVLWKGDEEFPPEGNLLFDRNISRVLSAEDIAWLAGMVVYPLVGMAKAGG